MGTGLGSGLTGRTVVSAVLAIALLVLAWPRAFGGATSYVVISGISMQPLMETGDLAVVRRAGSYSVGDVIAFQTVDGDVIHRITGGDGVTGYVTQGDNVAKVDPYRPTDADVRGRRLFHIPNLGAIGLRITNVVPPWGIGAAALALALASTPKQRGRRRRVRAGHRPITALPTRDEDPVDIDNLLSRRRLLLAGVCALVALVVLPSVVVAWTTPTRLPVAEPAQHQLDLAVTGIAGVGSTSYPSGRTATIGPDADGALSDDVIATPLIRSELTSIEVVASYALVGPAEGLDPADGIISVVASLITRNGDSVALPLGLGSLIDAAGSTTIELDLAAVDEAFASLPTGDDAVAAIELRPTAVLEAPESRSLTGEALLLTVSGENLVASGEARTLVELQATPAQAAKVGLLGIKLPTAVVRVLGLLILIGLGAGGWWLLQQEQDEDPELRIRLLYASLLVELAPGSDVGGSEVRVANMAELARLAKRDQRSILHRVDPDGLHRYLVPDGDLTYTFILDTSQRPVRSSGKAAAPVPPAVDPAVDAAVRIDDVALDSFGELSRLGDEPTADGVPGELASQTLADGRVLYTLMREGQRFTYLAAPSEKPHDTQRSGRRPTT